MAADRDRVRCFRNAVTALATVAVPIALGVALRLVGIDHGRPDMVFHPDVAKQTLVAERVAHGKLDVRALFGNDDVARTLYPYGTAWLTGTLARAAARLSGNPSAMVVHHRWEWALRMRYLAVCLYAACVLAVLLGLRSSLGPLGTLIAGLLLMLEPVGAQYSHYAMNDVPLTGLLLLAWVIGAKLGSASSRRQAALWSLAAGGTLGLAFGVKYQAVLGALLLLPPWILLLRHRGLATAAASAAALAVAAGAGVWMSCPVLRGETGYFAAHFGAFMRWQTDILGADYPERLRLSRNLVTAGRLLFGWSNGALAAAAVVTTVVGLRRRDCAVEVRTRLVSAALFCVALGGILVGTRDFVRSNDIVPLLAFEGVVLAHVTCLMPRTVEARGAATRRWIPLSVGAVGLALCGVFYVTTLRDSLALARPDTRLRARAWCNRELPVGASVLVERYVLPPQRSDLRVTQRRFLCDPRVRDAVSRGDFDYLVASSLAHERFMDAASAYHDAELAAFYDTLREFATTVAVFRDRELFFAHPTITVYACEARGAGDNLGL